MTEKKNAKDLQWERLHEPIVGEVVKRDNQELTEEQKKQEAEFKKVAEQIRKKTWH